MFLGPRRSMSVKRKLVLVSFDVLTILEKSAIGNSGNNKYSYVAELDAYAFLPCFKAKYNDMVLQLKCSERLADAGQSESKALQV